MDRGVLEKKTNVSEIADRLNRSRQTIYNVVNYLKKGGSIQQ
ncbi:HTH domain-containing protein [Treponema phagedenis]|uniref:HTH domain-containing protein n=1 Tax=Treponema phagedenis TaxID=162 RepID=A0A0B7GQ39_TREPH|nr:hypothetical protein HMPREF9554_01955 [Treponema phagedenis F0421]NVP24843.1 HTH domain-containing protein [Treponema phagedenis]QEJ95989.1 HTH domain-containing protein [Treponema phagedenis]QEJ98950.1 HTH domain-containing protein [Treponema phagedenis]QEK01752.1 HTH domain-containing protein [Treponema phagedenis]